MFVSHNRFAQVGKKFQVVAHLAFILCIADINDGVIMRSLFQTGAKKQKENKKTRCTHWMHMMFIRKRPDPDPAG